MDKSTIIGNIAEFQFILDQVKSEVESDNTDIEVLYSLKEQIDTKRDVLSENILTYIGENQPE